MSDHLQLDTDNDSLLTPFLRATDDEASQCLLEELIFLQAMPIITRIVGGFRLDGISAGVRLEPGDIEQDIVVRLVKRLRRLRTELNIKPLSISDFHRYVARMSKNVCNTIYRRNYPNWISVKNKLSYYLLENSRFKVWYDEKHRYGEERRLVCGLASWRAGSGTRASSSL